jgi:hypothetical protein
MACYDYQIAKDVLSDNDKNRLVCLYLNRRPPGDVSPPRHFNSSDEQLKLTTTG